MKVIAYIATDYIYFSKLLPLLSNAIDVFPIVAFDMFHKLGGTKVTQMDWAIFWNCILTAEKPDAIWCYGLPDEETLAAGKRHHIPVLIQEYYGHHPYNLSGIIPYGADWASYYREETAQTPPFPGRLNPRPNITLSLSEALYGTGATIPDQMETYTLGGSCPRYPYWHANEIAGSFVELAARLVAICREDSALRTCPVRVRLHPRYPELFQAVTTWVNTQNDPLTTMDCSPVAESLDWTDIAVHVNSNYGFDAVRAGAEVVSAGGFAFFDNPLYTRQARTIDELKAALKAAADKIRMDGKAVRSFIPFLLHDMERGGAFHHPCLEPYEKWRLAEVLSRAAQVMLPAYVGGGL